jgi:hypothetical protein
MAPPPNNIQKARASLYGEPAPSSYFQSTIPVGAARNAFGGSISPQYAAELKMDTAKYRSEYDDIQTRMAQNEMERARAASAGRILPFSEAAAIAQAQLNAEQYGASRGLVPLQTQSSASALKLEGAQAEASMADLPARMEAEQQQRIRDQQRYESGVDSNFMARLGDNPAAMSVFQAYQDGGPQSAMLTPEGRRKQAMMNALSVSQSAPYIEALDWMSQSKPGIREQFVEQIADPATGLPIAERLKQNLTPAQRAQMASAFSQYKSQRTRFAEEKEQRIAKSQQDAEKLRAFYRFYEDASNRYKDDQDPEAKKEMDMYKKRIESMIGDGGSGGMPSGGGAEDSF